MADQTITIRQDAQGYNEGLTVSQQIIIKIAEGSHWFPGVTYTEHRITDTGQILIPEIDTKTLGAVTDLCAPGDFAKAKGTYEPLLIDKVVTGEFDGCFTAAGIADKAFEGALNAGTKMVMTKQFEAYLDAQMYAKATKAPKTFAQFKEGYTGPKPAIAYLAYLASIVKKNTGRRPAFAFVNYDLEMMLVEEMGTLCNNSAGTIIVDGEIGNVLGMRIIAADITVAAVVGTLDAMNVGRPTKVTQIPNMTLPIGDIAAFTTNVISFDSGVVTKMDINAAGGVAVRTYMYLPIGTLLVPTLMVQGEVGAPTP